MVLVCPDGRQLQCSITVLSQHSKVLRDCFSQGKVGGVLGAWIDHIAHCKDSVLVAGQPGTACCLTSMIRDARVLNAQLHPSPNAPCTGNYGGQRLPVQGVDSGALAAVVAAMYSGECHVDLQTVCSIYDAAQKLQCQLLQDKCLQFIQATVIPENSMSLYHSAKAVHCSSLVDMLLEFIVARWVFVTGLVGRALSAQGRAMKWA